MTGVQACSLPICENFAVKFRSTKGFPFVGPLSATSNTPHCSAESAARSFGTSSNMAEASRNVEKRMTQIASVKLRGKDFFADANAGLSAAVVEKKAKNRLAEFAISRYW